MACFFPLTFALVSRLSFGLLSFFIFVHVFLTFSTYIPTQVHCSTVASKFECLLHMCRKLYSFVQGRCVADNADALSSHELLLPGHLFR